MAPPRPFPRRLLALTTLMLLSAAPALAGSVTADSILDQEGARQAAMVRLMTRVKLAVPGAGRPLTTQSCR